MNELYHHGRKGQQWGISNGPPYPLNKRGLSYYFAKKKITAADKKRIKEEQKTEKRQKEEEELIRKKDEVIRSGKASEVLKYQGRLTNQELQNAVNRLNLERTLKDYSSKEQKTSIQKVDDVMKTIDTTVRWTKTGISAYNTVAGMYNSLSSNPKKLKTIALPGGGEGKKKKK